MSTVEVLVRLDGETEALSLRDLAWEHVAPCGCTCGVMDADHAGADREAAYRECIPNADARKRDEQLGFLFRLARRGDVIDRMKARCPHTPQWGVEKVPVPDGHRWAVRGGSRRSHLVPVPAEKPQWTFQEWGASLCGSGDRDLWSAPWNDEPPCTRCERKAREIAAGGNTRGELTCRVVHAVTKDHARDVLGETDR